MTIKDLNENEQLALVALLRVIVQADKMLSSDETQVLSLCASEIGEKRFLHVTRRAHRELRDQPLAAVAKLVERPESRELLFSRLTKVAECDGLVPSEIEYLAELAGLWNITFSPR